MIMTNMRKWMMLLSLWRGFTKGWRSKGTR
jgi:hypothetical protein